MMCTILQVLMDFAQHNIRIFVSSYVQVAFRPEARCICTHSKSASNSFYRHSGHERQADPAEAYQRTHWPQCSLALGLVLRMLGFLRKVEGPFLCFSWVVLSRWSRYGL